MTTYFEKLRDPRWQKKRLEILQRDQFRCIECTDDTSTLHVHHMRYIKGRDPWDYSNGLLVTLCESCHETFHRDGCSAVEHVMGSFYDLGAGWSDLWHLAYTLDFSVPPTRKFSCREWEEVFNAMGEKMKEIAQRGSDGQN